MLYPLSYRRREATLPVADFAPIAVSDALPGACSRVQHMCVLRERIHRAPPGGSSWTRTEPSPPGDGHSGSSDAEARYRALVEQARIVVYEWEFGDPGHWRYLSPRIEEALGYRLAQRGACAAL